jgi:hypothetical protein
VPPPPGPYCGTGRSNVWISPTFTITVAGGLVNEPRSPIVEVTEYTTCTVTGTSSPGTDAVECRNTHPQSGDAPNAGFAGLSRVANIGSNGVPGPAHAGIDFLTPPSTYDAVNCTGVAVADTDNGPAVAVADNATHATLGNHNHVGIFTICK